MGGGWNGAELVIEDLANSVELISATLPNGSSATREFAVDCSDTFNPLPPVSISPTCNDIRMVLHTTGFGGDYGWEIWD